MVIFMVFIAVFDLIESFADAWPGRISSTLVRWFGRFSRSGRIPLHNSFSLVSWTVSYFTLSFIFIRTKNIISFLSLTLELCMWLVGDYQLRCKCSKLFRLLHITELIQRYKHIAFDLYICLMLHTFRISKWYVLMSKVKLHFWASAKMTNPSFSVYSMCPVSFSRLIILSLSVIYIEYDLSNKPIELLFFYKIGYICILVGECSLSLCVFIQSGQAAQYFANKFHKKKLFHRMFDWTMGFILCSTIINCDMDTFALLTPHTFIFFLSHSSRFLSVSAVSVCIELGICIISMRGSILDTAPRASIHYFLYGKLGKTLRKKQFSIFYRIMDENNNETVR